MKVSQKVKTAIPTLFNNYPEIKEREKELLKKWHVLNLAESERKHTIEEICHSGLKKRWIPIFSYIPTRKTMQRMILRASNLSSNF